MSEHQYQETLAQLAVTQPRIAECLLKAAEHREVRLNQYLNGARLAGLEQLYEYLDAAYDAYTAAPEPVPDEDGDAVDLRKVAFLINRVKQDFQTALEAAFSGYPAVASDMMRDVMETEALLLDFITTPSNLDEWLNASRKTLLNKFGPGKVRARLKAAGVSPWADDGFVAMDYQAHSQALHVSPQLLPLAARGIAAGSGGIFDDVPFMEMFEHGRRIMYAIELARVVALRLYESDGYEPLSARDKFDDAHRRTQEMQFVVTTIIGAPSAVANELGRPGTKDEVKQYVTQRFREFANALEASGQDVTQGRD